MNRETYYVSSFSLPPFPPRPRPRPPRPPRHHHRRRRRPPPPHIFHFTFHIGRKW